ncbi:hypothetical protein N7539_001162 [Penicillium diatomitis]|uniref:Uncharacterized protein n=1 Tax=Penicillium diatomitis TaxID=2819901 RepID=A0A9X0C317_9EURO|nr:uncharacterized protein N7539_001162 [Penicillium diatomitis]KAJ5496046.1 hypothetical protein N7539_001162 [Penicillium diatomitis]
MMNDGRGGQLSQGPSDDETAASIENDALGASTIATPQRSACTRYTQTPRSPKLSFSSAEGLTQGPLDQAVKQADRITTSERKSHTPGQSQPPKHDSQNATTIDNPASSSAEHVHDLRVAHRNTNGSSEYAELEGNRCKDPLHTPPLNHDGGDKPHSLKSEQSHDSPYLGQSHRGQAARSGVYTEIGLSQKRTATGDVKLPSTQTTSPRSSLPEGYLRRRSRSTNSPSSGRSRIAQLSVHIRTRLSYAAAKIERSQDSQSKLPRSLEHSGEGESPLHLGSNATSQLNNDSNALSTKPTVSHRRSQSAITSPHKLLYIPKLAPPAEIDASQGSYRRRRPNPNEAPLKPLNINGGAAYLGHKRHRSSQDLGGMGSIDSIHSSPRVVGLGTPSIPPRLRLPHSIQRSPYESRPQSPSTAMEQDAIETLLFMSSPENSGYRSSPRLLQPTPTQRSLNESVFSENFEPGPSVDSQRHGPHNGGYPQGGSLGLGVGLHSEDEIDRILDQMGSDSEDEARRALNRIEAQTIPHNKQGRLD